MSDTNSLNPLERTTDEAHPAEMPTLPATDACGLELFERLGVGGMGEVYRCGDDALGRDLAVKVLRSELRGNADAQERFLREARLTGSLQHPGVVPIHNLSRLADGRPCYTMKLVRGRTFADLLRHEPSGSERLPRLLAVVEKVCQAVAFAHSKGVIHRDLKPSNVMVGEFGEVQVMDWGLAKKLHVGSEVSSAAGRAMPAANDETAEWLVESTELSRAGVVLGTMAYMPPEQAVGDRGMVDERADVFALGAILCEVLTGRPPYQGSNREEMLRRAQRGELAEALDRLNRCGADEALVTLCRDCLSTEPWQRPRNANVVAERLAAYQAEVRERLRCAELERARAEVETREERKRRRLLAALALAAFVLLGGGVAVWWQNQQRQAEADTGVLAALGEAQLLRRQAQADPLTPATYEKALAAARSAAEMAHAGGASERVRRQADDLLAEVKPEAEAVAKDRKLLARVLDLSTPRERPMGERDEKGMLTGSSERSIDDQLAEAFRAWGLDVDAAPTSETLARLRERPRAVRAEVIAALDEWASQRLANGKPPAEWRRLTELAAALDDEPDSIRRELREVFARNRLPGERVLGMLSAAMRRVRIPAELQPDMDRVRLRRLAERTIQRLKGPDAAAESVLGLLTLARTLIGAGEEALAEELLRLALVAKPHEVVLCQNLGHLLTLQEPPRWSEAIGFYRAARGLRPELGLDLAEALIAGGEGEQGLDVLNRLVQDSPDHSFLHFKLGVALDAKGDRDGAIACYKSVLARDPNDVSAHNNLGNILANKGDSNGAIACYKKAIALDPEYAPAHHNLGKALADKGDPDEAITYYKKALALNPKLAPPHNELGITLAGKGDWDGAISCYKKAIALDPKFAPPHSNLGDALSQKDDLDGAIACYKKALALDPKSALIHFNFGNALKARHDLDGAIACYRKALELDPKYVPAHTNLGVALHDQHDTDGAIACYKKALALDPKCAQAHTSLGVALYERHDLDGAIACYKKAIALGPKSASPHYNLGLVLYGRHELSEAVACFQKAIALDPKYAGAWGALGQAHLMQGRYAEAQAETRRAISLLPSGDPQQRAAAQQLRNCEHYLTLANKLPTILQGEATPTNAGEAITLATMCQQHRKCHVAAARLFADAFATEPRLAADLDQYHRYNAACSAALAAAGQGEDARRLPDKVVAMFRRWALTWLRDDLSACAKLAGQNDPRTKEPIRKRLLHWQSDADLASVRDPQALDRLGDDERAAWQSLWRDVDKLETRLAKQSD